MELDRSACSNKPVIFLRSSRRQSGFTLLDVLVAVAIVAIFTAIAFPSYEAIAKQGRRADAVRELQDVMQQQERFFLNNMTYTTDLTELGYASNPLTSDDELYSIGASACGASIAQCVELTATTIDGSDGEITLDTQGNRGGTGGAEDVWKD